MVSLEDDPAIAMLKGVVEAHVEALRASIMEEVQGPLTVAFKCKLKSMKESFNQKIEEACKKVVQDVNAIIQKEIAQRVADALKSDDVRASLKEEISKRVAEALKDKETKVSNDDELSGDEDDADNDPGNLSDFEENLWGRSFASKSKRSKEMQGKKEKRGDEDDESDDEVPKTKRGRKKGSKNATKSKADLQKELAQLKKNLKK